MYILAIDPGYERLGVAVLEKTNRGNNLVYSECIQTDKKTAHEIRLAFVADSIEQIITEYTPDELAIETLFFNVNQKTAIKVAESRGVVLAVAAKNKLRVREFSPQEIKVAITGHGDSDKQQVTQMVQKLIQVRKDIRYDDEFDAIALGLTALAIQQPNG